MPGVRQAVVVGVPDDVMGERIGLAVVADAPLTLEAVRSHCTEAGLARFKVPERVVTVAEMPTLTVGKPDKSALRLLLQSS
jgi:non-ribosomal peptide synthetase component E (peptide arylation enzyme)